MTVYTRPSSVKLNAILSNMNTYQQFFGSGPRGMVISLALLALAWQLEPLVELPDITSSRTARWIVFAATSLGSILVLWWSIKSLPPAKRGTELITSGAYRYVRHPIYAAFLNCFNFGLAVLLNNWIYIIWAIMLHVVWHWNVRSEELLMLKEFPEEYHAYCQVTGRFFPKRQGWQHINPNPPTH